MKWITEEQPLQLNGDGTQQRDFTYVDDVATGVVKALDHSFGFETINLGSDRPVDLNYIISEIQTAVGKTAIIRNQPFPTTDMMATWANISRARELLGWEPKVDLEQGIALTVDWYLANRDFAKKIKI